MSDLSQPIMDTLDCNDRITQNCKIITQLVVLLNNDILSGKKEKMENNGRRI